MPVSDFQPFVAIEHWARRPTPILPVNYGYFLRTKLPCFAQGNGLKEQLAVARRAINSRPNHYRYDAPFGVVTGFGCHLEEGLVVHLGPEAKFVLPTGGRRSRCLSVEAVSKMGKWERHWVIGTLLGKGHRLVTADARWTNGPAYTTARKFSNLSDAFTAAKERNLSCFELLETRAGSSLREITTDWKLVPELPLEGTYQLADKLYAGPAWLAGEADTTTRRLERLTEAGVGTVIGIVSRAEFGQSMAFLNRLDLARRFEHHCFHVPRGMSPTRAQVRTTLDVVDATLAKGGGVYLTSGLGTGRSATLAGCWLARRAGASDPSALDQLAEARIRSGLVVPALETAAQRNRVQTWQKGD